MATDRELLELAAKVSGLSIEGWTLHPEEGMRLVDGDRNFVRYWSPLKDVGDAARLATKNRIHVGFYSSYVACQVTGMSMVTIGYGNDIDAAACRAIVTAAAAIGRNMP